MNNTKYTSQNDSFGGSEVMKRKDLDQSRIKACIKAAKRTAGNKSEISGTYGKVEGHHIESVQSRPDLAYDQTNIIVLTHDEHRAFHNHYGATGNTSAQMDDFKSNFKAIMAEEEGRIRARRTLKNIADRNMRDARRTLKFKASRSFHNGHEISFILSANCDDAIEAAKAKYGDACVGVFINKGGNTQVTITF